MSLNDAFREIFRCLICGEKLSWMGHSLTCENDHHFPVIRGIPRFVSSDGYAGSFSFEWNVHNNTQLDTHRDDGWSEETFRQKTGLTPDDVRGKLVLDAGAGAGRYAEILSRWGANVVGADLSLAVEAAAGNVRGRENALIVQGDIGNLPFGHGTFDHIVSIGVLHHTPDTRRYTQSLIKLLKPGGRIAIWLYHREGELGRRPPWIPVVSSIPSPKYYDWCRWFVPLTYKYETTSFMRFIRCVFPYSVQHKGIENDILDTFDGYSPVFHGVHTNNEVKVWFHEMDLEDVTALDWPVSVVGYRPRERN